MLIDINQAKQQLLNHQVIGVYTDTLIGLACLVSDQDLLYEIKNRPLTKKNIYLINSIDQIKNFDSKYLAICKQYWPGNVTLIINDQGYRICNNQQLNELIALLDQPLVVSSANLSGQDPVTNADEFSKTFKDIDLFDNYMPLTNQASTILKVDQDLQITKLR